MTAAIDAAVVRYKTRYAEDRKHLVTKSHFLWAKTEIEIVSIHCISPNNLAADILTNPLLVSKVEKFREVCLSNVCEFCASVCYYTIAFVCVCECVLESVLYVRVVLVFIDFFSVKGKVLFTN